MSSKRYLFLNDIYCLLHFFIFSLLYFFSKLRTNKNKIS